MKKHYLVTQITKFIDPHGTPDFGGQVKFVSSNPLFEKITSLDHFRYEIDGYDINDYDDFIEEEKVDIKEVYSEDGYNYEVYNYIVKSITEEEAKEYSQIIEAYNKL